MLLRAEDSGILEGFLVERSRTKVTNLQFSNIMFFSNARMEELRNLKIILLIIGCISRLKINLDKSTLSRINMSQDQMARFKLC